MHLHSFQLASINPRLGYRDRGHAFEAFVGEFLLPEFPELRSFSVGAGKDGGIDHMVTFPDYRRFVVECKSTDKAQIKAVLARWHATERNLRKNLPLGSGRAQPLYEPWFRTDKPIVRYIFCINVPLKGGSLDKLESAITGFFSQLAGQYDHLRHLAPITVEIRTWEHFVARISPALTLRWFLSKLPKGVRALVDVERSASGFRAWLHESHLSFYKRAAHLTRVPAPAGTEIYDEEALLDLVGKGGYLGLVITGRGGVGKTRLSLELGQIAQNCGWQVWLIRDKFSREALDALVFDWGAKTPTLLIFDYVEVHSELADVAEHLEELVDEFDLPIRYVVTCRASYYGAISTLSRHKRVELSAQTHGRLEQWLAGYRRAAVRYILERAGFPVTENHLRACHDVPVLAVFLHWLQSQGRNPLLTELIQADDFGQWVLKRMRLSFGNRAVDRKLAVLAALLPFNTRVDRHLEQDAAELLERLAIDGWVERVDDQSGRGEQWQAIHDVLADRVVVAWLDEFGGGTFAPEWVSEVLRDGVRLDALGSAIRTLQRVAEHIPLNTKAWERLVESEIARKPKNWRSVRELLLQSSLLSASPKVRFLARYPVMWTAAERSSEFHSSLAQLLRACVRDDIAIAANERAALIRLIWYSLSYQKGTRYLLAWALRLYPEEFRDEGLSFILAHATHLGIANLIHAWLAAGLPSAEIRKTVEAWCKKNRASIWLTRVAPSWLEHGGDRSVVEEYLPAWLKEHGLKVEARFLLMAWLGATQDRAFVESYVLAWLKENGPKIEADFVLAGWLSATKDKLVVQDHVTEWLKEHGRKFDARFVFTAWLDATKEPAMVEEYVAPWLREYGLQLDAGFVLAAWLNAGAGRELVADRVFCWLKEHGLNKVASYVLTAWLDATKDITPVQEYIINWLNTYPEMTERASWILRTWVRAGADPEIAQGPMIQWLTNDRLSIQAQYVLAAWLKARNSPDVVERYVVDWLDKWGTAVEASFVMGPWLEAGGRISVVERFVRPWLDNHRDEASRSFVIFPWLGAGGSADLVSPFLDNAASSSALNTATGLSLIARLRQDPTLHREIEEWFKNNLQTDSGCRLLESWIRSSPDLATVENTLKVWLITNKRRFRTSFIVQAWLEAGGTPSLVREALIEWFLAKPTANHAPLRQIWLAARGDPEIFEKPCATTG
jgi:hypothetical protein